MSALSHGGPGSPSNRENDDVSEDPTVASTSGGDSARVTVTHDDKPVETRSFDDMQESRVLKLDNVDCGTRDASEAENQSSSSISRGQDNDSTKTDVGDIKSGHEKVKRSIDDYDSILSEFDQFAAKGLSEAVGYGYEIGDMVWGKVKSHPWWPGHIYNEAFASPSVQRSKREGHVLVAFFGDSSYGWFDPAELVPFQEHFVEKSRQVSSRAFVRAVDEALDELSRRRSVGLACRCRNEFNFWPSSVKGYFVVDVGDYEPAVYSTSQINKARESFHPNEMLSFVQQLALTPMTHQHWTVEFIKNKATVLACRKALFEEFDETYAQAFGTVQERTPRPSAPAAVDPSKAPLSGRLVFAETQRKLQVKPTKSKDQLEKEKYLFKRRDEPIRTKTKKTGKAQIGGPLLLDGSGLSGTPLDSAIKGHMQQSSVNQASVISYTKPSEGSMKLVEVGKKKTKLHKQWAGESGAENTTLVVKKRKIEITGENVNLVEKTKKRKKDIRSNCGTSVQEVSETSLSVKDLHALAINPFHGIERSCLATTRLVFLKYRALVYQKSLVSSPQAEIERSKVLPVPPEKKINDRSTMKPVRPLVRPDDPTRGGRKRGPSDRPEPIRKKKKLEGSDDINRRKELADSEDANKKKNILDSKSLSLEKKIPQRSTESPSVPKVVKLESSKRIEQPRKARNPTMLVLKFPSGASLPSGNHLRAKFARFGLLDHDATRVFWKTDTCRLVFLYKANAEKALKFARETCDLFGGTLVRSYIREVGPPEAVETEPIKAQKEDTTAAGAAQLREGSVEQTAPVRVAVQPHQQSAQLKSCLKKQSVEEVGNGNNGRGTSRVKFILGGEESTKAEQLSSFSVDITSENLPKFNPHSNVTPPMPTHQLQNFPNNRASVVNSTPIQEPKNDISQQFLKLLIRCNDVVNNLSGVLGYVPYHLL